MHHHKPSLFWPFISSLMKAFIVLVFFSLFLMSPNSMALPRNLHDDMRVAWGDGRCNIIDDGKLVSVTLDKESGSGFESKKDYLFAMIDFQIKLVPNNSAGTVTAYYLSSQGDHHDEIDFEFLGNVSGDPYTLHTNVFCQGKGSREQQFRLWFDPTTDFHTYSIHWTPLHILFLVDGIPIREFKNMESFEIPYPKNQPMKVYASLWNADDWATRGGLVKTDWSKAPFNAFFRNFTAHKTCIWSHGASSCESSSAFSSYNKNAWHWDKLDYEAEGKMKMVQRKYMVYNYCTDTKRFPQGLPKECYLDNFNY